MKPTTLLLIISVTFLFSSCNLRYNKQLKEAEEKMIKAELWADSSDRIVTDIILGLQFGMTESEIKKVLLKKVDEGTVSLDQNNSFVFVIEDISYTFSAHISPEYIDGKLSSLKLLIDEKDTYSKHAFFSLWDYILREYETDGPYYSGIIYEYEDTDYAIFYAGKNLKIIVAEGTYEKYRIVFEDRLLEN